MTEIRQMYKTVMDDHFPPEMRISFGDQTLIYRKRTWKLPDNQGGLVEKGLRYGENPGQEAAMYELVGGNLMLGGCQFITPGNGMVSAISEAEMLQAGKHPGKTNLTDVDNALNIIKFLGGSAAAVIVKHNNPCGVATGANLTVAYHRANRADRIAAFGGALVVNEAVDLCTAGWISENYLEVVAAPDFEEDVLEVLGKRKNLRIIRIPNFDRLADFKAVRFLDFKSLIDGGIIVQQSPVNAIRGPKDLQLAECSYQGKIYRINREPTEEEYVDIVFGWAVEQGVSSNSVIYVKDECTVGIGTGEQDRVGVAGLAVIKAYQKYADAMCSERYGISFNELKLAVERGERPLKEEEDILAETAEKGAGLIGSVMVSDAFFPFRDGVDVGLRVGVSAIVHPGGSDRDWESIEACNEAGVAMVFTGQRAFKH